MVEYLAQALRQTSRKATVLLYAPALDLHLQKIAGLSNLDRGCEAEPLEIIINDNCC